MNDRSNFITFHKKDFTIEQIKNSCEGFEVFICEITNNGNDHINEYVFIYPEENEKKNFPDSSNNLAEIISKKLHISALWVFFWETSICVSVHSNGKLDSFFERNYSDIIYDWWGITNEQEEERQIKAKERKKNYLKKEKVLNISSLSKVYPKIDKSKNIDIDGGNELLFDPGNLEKALNIPSDLFYNHFGCFVDFFANEQKNKSYKISHNLSEQRYIRHQKNINY